MTKITELYKDDVLIGFRVEGHAGYSIPGRDIVCAAISALTINTINSISELSNIDIDIKECDNGNMEYSVVTNPDLITATLLNAVHVGYKNLSEQYPDNVSFMDKAVIQ